LDIYANPDNNFSPTAKETTMQFKDMAAICEEALAQLEFQDQGHFLQWHLFCMVNGKGRVLPFMYCMHLGGPLDDDLSKTQIA
jgi:hypothetical protein